MGRGDARDAGHPGRAAHCVLKQTTYETSQTSTRHRVFAINVLLAAETLSDVIAEFARQSTITCDRLPASTSKTPRTIPANSQHPSTAGSVTFGQGSAPFITR